MPAFTTRILAAGKTTALFLAVAALSVFALVWMGARLLSLEGALETQQLTERRETAADRVVAGLEQALSAEERRLDIPSPPDSGPVPEGMLLLSADDSGFHAQPERLLLFLPALPDSREIPAAPFAAADAAEFRHKDSRAAILLLQGLSKAEDPALRAGAGLRLARNLRKTGRREAALAIYQELERSANREITLDGVPVDLVAAHARCTLLAELRLQASLQQAARALREGLLNGRWRLDRAAYEHYSQSAANWLGVENVPDPERQAMAEAAEWVWQFWSAGRNAEQHLAGSRTFGTPGSSVALLWRRSSAHLSGLILRPDYQRSRWFDPLFRNMEPGGVRVSLVDAGGAALYGTHPPSGLTKTVRAASATGLPWDVVAVASDLDADLNQFAQRRRLMMAGLATLVVLVIAASLLIRQSVARELAAAKLKSDFVSAVSHEFRTPLTSMRQFTEMLVEEEELPPEKRRMFYLAQERATRRLSRLVESLLDFGRMEAGARPYRLAPLDLAELVRSVVEEFRQESGCEGFKIDYSGPPKTVQVLGDREALSQALWNLLDNAAKYSGTSRSIRVEVEGGSHAVIRVQDRGLGIPATEQQRIFEKFTRGSGAEALGIKGTGIGLSMVRHIVEAHGGEVRVQSEPGQGSSFTIRLPGEA